MKPLRATMTLPLRDGEVATSYVSRVAANLGRTMHDFCLDMRLNFQSVVNGDDETLQEVADLCRVDLEQLRRNAIVREGNRFRLRNEVLTAETLEQAQVRVCPSCVEEDLQKGEGELATRTFGRAVWRIAAFRTCNRHGTPLTNVAQRRLRWHLFHDYAYLVAQWLPNHRESIQTPATRAPSGLDTYVIGRLSEEASSAPWLDGLPFYAATKVCQVIGAVAEFGRKVQFRTLSEDDWHRAGATGFQIAARGEAGIRSFLGCLGEEFFSSRDAWGPGRVFGRLYHWLAHESGDPAYEPLRDLIYQFMIESMPVGHGDRIFDREVTERRVHSLRSISNAAGFYFQGLRTLLHEGGYISDEALQQSPDRILISANEANDFLDVLAGSIPVGQAAAYINAPSKHCRLLFERGYILAGMVSSKGKQIEGLVSRKQLDDFLENLSEGAQEIDSTSSGIAQIRLAATRSSVAEIVDLILSRKVRTYRLRGEEGYQAIAVDVADLSRAVKFVRPARGGRPRKPQSDDILTFRKAAGALRVKHSVIVGLVEQGVLPLASSHDTAGGWAKRVSRKDIEAFAKRYISLYSLARGKGTSLPHMKKKLAEEGLGPAFDPEKISATFYEKAAVPAWAAGDSSGCV